MPFLPPNQQCQSAEGIKVLLESCHYYWHRPVRAISICASSWCLSLHQSVRLSVPLIDSQLSVPESSSGQRLTLWSKGRGLIQTCLLGISHAMHRCSLFLLMLHVPWSVCLSVSVLCTLMSPAKTDDQMTMAFSGQTHVGPRNDTIQGAILLCARKPIWVSLVYCMEPTTKKCKTEKLQSKNGYAQK